tara:strand:- start:84 stop:332 length:249 start_codon:yes stop_codon:yes gene_type:complete
MVGKLENAILKQAIRDLASKHIDYREDAKKFFSQESFDEICKSKKIKPDEIRSGVAILLSYPLLSRKKMADKISRMLDIEMV